MVRTSSGSLATAPSNTAPSNDDATSDDGSRAVVEEEAERRAEAESRVVEEEAVPERAHRRQFRPSMQKRGQDFSSCRILPMTSTPRWLRQTSAVCKFASKKECPTCQPYASIALTTEGENGLPDDARWPASASSAAISRSDRLRRPSLRSERASAVASGLVSAMGL